MGIGENDWLAQEYKREGRPISSAAAKRLEREHMLDCDARGIRVRHAMECAADQVRRETRQRAHREGGPPWPRSARNRKLTRDSASMEETFKKLLDYLMK